MTAITQVTGLILAGGAGRRVQGRDKGLLAWRDKTLVGHVIERLGPQVDRLLISCNRNEERYRDFGVETLSDSRQDFQGPLAGLEAAAKLIETEYIVISPCDTPLIPRDLVTRLILPLQHPASTRPDISYAHDGQRDQYLCALIRRDCLQSVCEYLDADQRSVHKWYRLQKAVAVDFSDCPGAFRNLNHLN